MPKQPISVQSVLICDDARREESGKEILIGVYADAIIVPAFPSTMNQIVIRIALTVEFDEDTVFRIQVQNPEQGVLLDASRKIPLPSAGKNLILIFAARNPSFQKEGTYKVLFGPNNDLKEIHRFSVRGPRTDEETARLTS